MIKENIKHASDDVEASMEVLITDLVEEAKWSSKTPEGAIKVLKKAKSELPDYYAGTMKELIEYSLMSKAIDDAISQIYDLALKREW